MLLFFDTETTGLPNYKRPIADAAQPHIVQLAAILTENDGRERASINLIVNPGVAIPEIATKTHGITDEIAQRCGVPQKVAVLAFSKLMDRADTIIAHNTPFDLFIMRSAFARSGVAFPTGLPWRCTMEASKKIVNLPPTDKQRAAGFTGPKLPRLEECIKHFFNEQLDGAHDAMVDVRACARVHFHLANIIAGGVG
jgi:DNA polymerase III subunit epsilon